MNSVDGCRSAETRTTPTSSLPPHVPVPELSRREGGLHGVAGAVPREQLPSVAARASDSQTSCAHSHSEPEQHMMQRLRGEAEGQAVGENVAGPSLNKPRSPPRVPNLMPCSSSLPISGASTGKLTRHTSAMSDDGVLLLRHRSSTGGSSVAPSEFCTEQGGVGSLGGVGPGEGGTGAAVYGSDAKRRSVGSTPTPANYRDPEEQTEHAVNRATVSSKSAAGAEKDILANLLLLQEDSIPFSPLSGVPPEVDKADSRRKIVKESATPSVLASHRHENQASPVGGLLEDGSHSESSPGTTGKNQNSDNSASQRRRDAAGHRRDSDNSTSDASGNATCGSGASVKYGAGRAGAPKSIVLAMAVRQNLLRRAQRQQEGRDHPSGLDASPSDLVVQAHAQGAAGASGQIINRGELFGAGALPSITDEVDHDEDPLLFSATGSSRSGSGSRSGAGRRVRGRATTSTSESDRERLQEQAEASSRGSFRSGEAGSGRKKIAEGSSNFRREDGVDPVSQNPEATGEQLVNAGRRFLRWFQRQIGFTTSGVFDVETTTTKALSSSLAGTADTRNPITAPRNLDEQHRQAKLLQEQEKEAHRHNLQKYFSAEMTAGSSRTTAAGGLSVSDTIAGVLSCQESLQMSTSLYRQLMSRRGSTTVSSFKSAGPTTTRKSGTALAGAGSSASRGDVLAVKQHQHQQEQEGAGICGGKLNRGASRAPSAAGAESKHSHDQDLRLGGWESNASGSEKDRRRRKGEMLNTTAPAGCTTTTEREQPAFTLRHPQQVVEVATVSAPSVRDVEVDASETSQAPPRHAEPEEGGPSVRTSSCGRTGVASEKDIEGSSSSSSLNLVVRPGMEKLWFNMDVATEYLRLWQTQTSSSSSGAEDEDGDEDDEEVLPKKSGNSGRDDGHDLHGRKAALGSSTRKNVPSTAIH
mmetsp:Transcript_14361/g.35807  ORF Transcript_14361/g.35807 Transcript_14361/m.35807 type:complete len:925 (+) Transcript_14361:586-3360(+)